MNQGKLHKEQHSFSLLELLIVIAMIVILASFLLPALGKARGKAMQISCTGNQKQVIQGYLIYSMNNNEIMPIDCYNPETRASEPKMNFRGFSGPKNATWFWYIRREVGASDDMLNADGSVNHTAAIREKSIRSLISCPAFHERKYDPTYFWTDYGMPVHYIGGLGFNLTDMKAPTRLPEIPRPSGKLFLTDSKSNLTNGDIVGVYTVNNRNIGSQTNKYGNYDIRRHDGNLVSAFGDGHVSSVRYTTLLLFTGDGFAFTELLGAK